MLQKIAEYPYQDLGNRCRSLRKQKGLSQMDVVRNFNFSLSHYQKIERGALDPRLSTLRKLAEIYQMPVSEMLEGL